MGTLLSVAYGMCATGCRIWTGKNSEFLHVLSDTSPITPATQNAVLNLFLISYKNQSVHLVFAWLDNRAVSGTDTRYSREGMSNSIYIAGHIHFDLKWAG